jgi:signal transduction histidine kinase
MAGALAGGHDDGVRPLSRTRVQRWVDGAIPVGVALFLVLLVLDARPPGRQPAVFALGCAVAVGSGAALRWRRSRPVAVTAAALVGGLGMQLIAPSGTFPYAGLFAIGSLAAARPPRLSVPALAALVALTATNFVTASAADTWFAMTIAVVPWALGEAVRNRRVAIDGEARRAVAEERARIAREMHDIIAHSVSVIVVQASAAEDVFDTRPEAARLALRSIEAAGRDALGELRRLLAAVRPDPDGDPTRPRPGLDQVDTLAEPLRVAGLAVAVRREGSVRELAAGVDLTAYRIVREALTNTLRHAGAARADVTLRYRADSLEIDITDDGRGGVDLGSDPRAPGGPAGRAGRTGGLGLVGMRERVAMQGGQFDAGPLPAGGFRVRARLPLESSAATGAPA